MKIYTGIDQKSEEWLNLRKGKITGTDLKRIVGTATTRDNCFYDILAERLTAGISEESALDRGNRLEQEALEYFEKHTGKMVDKVALCENIDNEFIASSPDGLIKVKGEYTEAVEVKCLSSANHIRIWLENEIPKEFYPQCIQYFIVNDELETLHFVSYDPRVSIHPIHIIEINRKDVAETIKEYKQKEEDFLLAIEDTLKNIIEL